MSISTFLIRTVGLTTTALVGYDTLKMTNHRASHHTRHEVSEDLADILVRNVTNGNGSHLNEEMKKKYFKYRLEENITPTLKYGKNYVEKFGESLAFNAAAIGLGLTAMFAKAKSSGRHLYKGFIPKPIAVVATLGIGAMAVSNIFGNVLGIKK